VPHLTSYVLLVDSRGTLWAGVNQTVLYLKQGSKRFEPTGAFAGFSISLAEAPDGTMWLSDGLGYDQTISMSVRGKSAAMANCKEETPKGKSPECTSEDPLVVKISAAANLLFDQEGSLWMTTQSAGAGRLPHPERLRGAPISETGDTLQRFTYKDGLSADNCFPILEDRERNIWVATRDGLDQFRDTALVPVSLPTSNVHIAIAAADGGDIWVASTWSHVSRIHGESMRDSLIPGETFKPCRDPARVTWFMGGEWLGQWKDGRFRKVAQSPDGRAGGYKTWQIAGDVGLFQWSRFLLFGPRPMESLADTAGAGEGERHRHVFRQHRAYLGVNRHGRHPRAGQRKGGGLSREAG
jgi:ligand-binding sensor domain-containing protein